MEVSAAGSQKFWFPGRSKLPTISIRAVLLYSIPQVDSHSRFPQPILRFLALLNTGRITIFKAGWAITLVLNYDFNEKQQD